MRWLLSLALVLALPALSLADVLCAYYAGLRHGQFRYLPDQTPEQVARQPGEVCFAIALADLEDQRRLWQQHAPERLEIRRRRGTEEGRLYLRPPDVPRPPLDIGRPAP